LFFRQKNEEKYASQKYIKDTLNRSVPVLPSVDEEQQTDNNSNNSSESIEINSSELPQNITTYKRAYQNYNQSASTNGTSSSKKKIYPMETNKIPKKMIRKNKLKQFNLMMIVNDLHQHHQQKNHRKNLKHLLDDHLQVINKNIVLKLCNSMMMIVLIKI